MKALTLITTLLLSLTAHALTLKFIGPCDENFIMKTEVPESFANVGELTVAVLSKFGIPYQGTPEGISSAFNTPTGKGAMEILSNVEMRAYGWCFAVDGISPEVYPHEAEIGPLTKEITWTFGFAHYYKGEWITQCTPAYKIKPAFLCEDKP